MNTDAIKKIRGNLSLLLPPVVVNNSTENTTDNEVQEDEVPSSLSNLPKFSVIKDLHRKKSEILKLKHDQNLKPLLKQLERIQTIVGNGVQLSQDMANHLEFIRHSSHILVQALKDPMVHDSLPVPHPLHRKIIDMIEACIWIVQHDDWQPLQYKVEWDKILPKLQEEVSYWMSCCKQCQNNFKEVEDLKQKLNFVLQSYPEVNL